LQGAGALVVGFNVARLAGRLGGAPESAAAQGINGAGSNQLDAWIAIAADGRVTGYTGKCELGQGLFTAQTQLVAEELAVPLGAVTLVQCDTALTPDQGTTSGSQSHPANFNESNLAQAAATAREALLQVAATRLGMPRDRLVAQNGAVHIKDEPARSVGYGELIGGKKFNLAVDDKAKRRDPREWTILGTAVPRLDAAALATARFEFVHNVKVPGMLHGRVVRPPEIGATLMGVDESSVSSLPGFVKVVTKKNFVGVVAEKPWQAVQAAAKLKVTWSRGAGLPDQRTFYDYLRNQKPTRDTFVVNAGDVDDALKKSAQIVRATYTHPYQAHGSLGSSCAVADVKSDKATIWSPTQSAYPQRNTVAMLLGLRPESVRIVFAMGSGCYGLNGADTVSYDAALLSQAVGRPVRVQLMRKDEMAWENYGTAFVIDQRVGVDTAGNILAWDYEAWSTTLGGRPGNTPGNVVTGLLAGFEPVPFTPRSPAPPPAAFGNNGNAAPSYVAGSVGGRENGTGTVKNERVLSHSVKSLFWTGPLRSPERLQNTFAHESLMDEVAALVKADSVAYRLRHLRDPRLIEVVRAAAKTSNWESRPSPRPTLKKTGMAAGRGMACVLYEGSNGYVAMVAEVEVDQDSGRVLVKRFVVAQDVGPISNPDGLKNQLEGGTLQGMSRALGEEVTWDATKITSVDWRTYHPLYLGAEVPKIESVLINRFDVPAMGAGETSITLVAAALGNAIFDATGARLRQVPFTPERVKTALSGR
jgi:CO/xanthine dehydrogenase Mo-binding subunit